MLVKNANVSYPLVFNLHHHLESLRIFAQNFNTKCPSSWAIRWYKNIAEKFIPVGSMHQRHRHTTNGQLMNTPNIT